MRQMFLVFAAATAVFGPFGSAQQDGPYKVLKTTRVGVFQLMVLLLRGRAFPSRAPVATLRPRCGSTAHLVSIAHRTRRVAGNAKKVRVRQEPQQPPDARFTGVGATS